MYIYEGCTIEEVQAMRDLQDEPFDFGSGLITVDCKESEDFYFRSHLNYFLFDFAEDLYHQEWLNELTLEMKYDSFFSGKDMTRAKRRKTNWKKAIHKRDNGYKMGKLHREEIVSLSSFNKGKNHCSCGQCSDKTNVKKPWISWESEGGVAHEYPTSPNWKASDRRSIERCGHSLKEYLDGNSFDFWKEYWMWEARDETDIQLREEDQEILLDYLFNTSDNVNILHDGTVQYLEKYNDWIERIDWSKWGMGRY